MSDRWLYDFDHFPMKIHHNPEASHAQVIPHILGKPCVAQLLKLIQGVLKLAAGSQQWRKYHPDQAFSQFVHSKILHYR